MSNKKVFSLDPETIPWNKLTDFQKAWLQHTIEFQKNFNCTLPQNCFTMLVCKSILSKVQ